MRAHGKKGAHPAAALLLTPPQTAAQWGRGGGLRFFTSFETFNIAPPFQRRKRERKKAARFPLKFHRTH